MLSWRDAVFEAVIRVCNRRQSSLFDRATLLEEELDTIVAETASLGKTPEQTLSRILQQLRDEGWIEFVDYEGRYRFSRWRDYREHK